MLGSPANRLSVYVSLAFGLVLGYGFVKLLPIASSNPAFLFVLPLLCLLFLGIVLNLKSMIALLLFMRVLLDPVLNMTKSESLGLGLGAVLNLFVLLLTA